MKEPYRSLVEIRVFNPGGMNNSDSKSHDSSQQPAAAWPAFNSQEKASPMAVICHRPAPQQASSSIWIGCQGLFGVCGMRFVHIQPQNGVLVAFLAGWITFWLLPCRTCMIEFKVYLRILSSRILARHGAAICFMVVIDNLNDDWNPTNAGRRIDSE